MCSDLRDGPGLAHLLLSPVDPWQLGALPGALDLHETAVDGLDVHLNRYLPRELLRCAPQILGLRPNSVSLLTFHGRYALYTCVARHINRET